MVHKVIRAPKLRSIIATRVSRRQAGAVSEAVRYAADKERGAHLRGRPRMTRIYELWRCKVSRFRIALVPRQHQWHRFEVVI